MRKKLKVIITGLIIYQWIVSSFIYAQEFTDVELPTQKAAVEFNNRGILKNFIYKYGKKTFRPLGTVSREELLLTLYEYDATVRWLKKENEDLKKEIASLKTPTTRKPAGPSAAAELSKDEIINEAVRESVKRALVLILNSKEITTMKNDIDNIKSGTPRTPPSSDVAVKKPEKPIENLEESGKTAPSSDNKTKNAMLTKLSIGLTAVAVLFMAR
ncbi:MAG: hypothetical protein AB1349_10920 [Elusimicrobiota bacterium]